MQRLNNESSTSTTIQELCEEYRAHNMITKEECEQNRVSAACAMRTAPAYWRG